MKLSLQTLNNNIEKMQFQVKKNSPLIFTALGMLGLGITAWEAYEARKKVDTITEEFEMRKAEGEQISPVEVATRVGLAVAPTVIIGGLSLSSIFGGYHVLNNRLKVTAAALATATTEHRRYRDYVVSKHPELAHVEGEKEMVYLNKEESEKKKGEMVEVQKQLHTSVLQSISFQKSRAFISDDLYFNQMFITDVACVLTRKLTDRGYITLNEIWDALEIPREETNRSMGAQLGFTSNDYFDLVQTIALVKDEEGYAMPVPIVEYLGAHLIYDVDTSSDLDQYRGY